jgi:hypothetical protein
VTVDRLHGPAVQAINEFADGGKIASLSPINQPVRNPAQAQGALPKGNPQGVSKWLLAVYAPDWSAHSISPTKRRKSNPDRGWN